MSSTSPSLTGSYGVSPISYYKAWQAGQAQPVISGNNFLDKGLMALSPDTYTALSARGQAVQPGDSGRKKLLHGMGALMLPQQYAAWNLAKSQSGGQLSTRQKIATWAAPNLTGAYYAHQQRQGLNTQA